MEIVLVGLNFRTAPVEVREKVSFSTEQAQRAAEELRAQGILEETLVLSTCNRSEVYGVHPTAKRASAAALSSFLCKFHSVQPELLNLSLTTTITTPSAISSAFLPAWNRCCLAKRKFSAKSAKPISVPTPRTLLAPS